MGSIFSADIVYEAITILAVLVSIVLHECAHGYVAYLCGDNTAKDAGRLTLNPLKHLDLFGSLILPAALALLGGPIFAYAKPVPYNPYNLRHRRRDELLVALSGPAANLVQALVGAAIFRLLWAVAPYSLGAGFGAWVADFLTTYVYVNLMLMFFNLIPLPPLDGSAIIGWFMRGSALQKYYAIQRYSMPILIIVLFLVPMVSPIDPLAVYIDNTAWPLYLWLCGFW